MLSEAQLRKFGCDAVEAVKQLLLALLVRRWFLGDERNRATRLKLCFVHFAQGSKSLVMCGRFQFRQGNQYLLAAIPEDLAVVNQQVGAAFNRLIHFRMAIQEAHEDVIDE